MRFRRQSTTTTEEDPTLVELGAALKTLSTHLHSVQELASELGPNPSTDGDQDGQGSGSEPTG